MSNNIKHQLTFSPRHGDYYRVWSAKSGMYSARRSKSSKVWTAYLYGTQLGTFKTLDEAKAKCELHRKIDLIRIKKSPRLAQ